MFENLYNIASSSPRALLKLYQWFGKYLSSSPKLFADDTSLFSVVRDLNTSANEINCDLKMIEAWAQQMSFNWDPFKHTQSNIFSPIRNKPHHPDIISNVSPVTKALTKNICKCFLTVNLILMNCIGLIRKLWNFLPRSSLLQIYKSLLDLT